MNAALEIGLKIGASLLGGAIAGQIKAEIEKQQQAQVNKTDAVAVSQAPVDSSKTFTPVAMTPTIKMGDDGAVVKTEAETGETFKVF